MERLVAVAEDEERKEEEVWKLEEVTDSELESVVVFVVEVVEFNPAAPPAPRETLREPPGAVVGPLERGEVTPIFSPTDDLRACDPSAGGVSSIFILGVERRFEKRHLNLLPLSQFGHDGISEHS